MEDCLKVLEAEPFMKTEEASTVCAEEQCVRTTLGAY